MKGQVLPQLPGSDTRSQVSGHRGGTLTDDLLHRLVNVRVGLGGDEQDYDSYLKFDRERNYILRSKFDYISTNYNRLLKKGVPALQTERVIVFLFFPFTYWNRYIEHRRYKGIYGNRLFHRKFVAFWNRINRVFERSLKEKEILFINPSSLCGLYRDKLIVRKEFMKAKIPMPETYNISRTRNIKQLLGTGKSFFLKPRYGSMGKGITFLSESNWRTNFVYRNNRIMSRKSDRGWKFRDITGNYRFLRKLIRKDIMIERAIDSLMFRNHKIDMRVYVFFNKVLYIYPRKNRADGVTTNISQGAKGTPSLLQRLPQPVLNRTKELAVNVSKALKLSLVGMDIMVDKNLKAVYVVDVNVFPGFPKQKTFNLSRYMIRELADMRNRGKLRFAKYRFVSNV